MTARRHRARWRWRALAWIGLLGLALWIGYEAWTWPDVAALARRNPATTAFMEHYRQEQRAAGRDNRVAWVWVPYAGISPHLKRAVLVAEDFTFFSHGGFDLSEMTIALREAILTWQLEHALTKRRILELYLNVVEFGPTLYGAEAASRRYFGKPGAELGEDQAARLAASLPNPAAWHPGSTSRGLRATRGAHPGADGEGGVPLEADLNPGRGAQPPSDS